MILVLGVLALAATAWFVPLGSVQATVASLGLLGPVIGVLLGAALLIALVPRTPISVACGVLFGVWTGMIVALSLAMIAAVVTFGAGRWLGRDFVARHAGRRWARIERWITREGVLAVAAVRAIPLGPYGLMGYAYGASAVRLRDYALGTFIAGAPSAVTYALLGAAVAGATPASPLTFVPLAFGLVLCATLIIRARYRPSIMAEPAPQGADHDQPAAIGAKVASDT